jgi:hypothetical protein
MHIDMEPMRGPEHDDEGRMAKADLYKLANYSLKLFKQLDNSQQLEGWVQAKITKAADYIASVYHYMEYEMKFSEYGQAIEDSDVYTESQKRQLKNKLFEAKEKIKDLKKAQAEKLKKKEKKDIEEASGFRATDKKKGKVEKSEKKQYFVKLEKEGKTKGMTMVADEGETEGDIRDRAKRDNQGWTVASVRVKDSGSGEEVSETFMPNKKKEKDDPVTGTVKKAGKLVAKGVNKAVDAAKGALSDKKVPEARMKDKKSQEGNKFTGNLMKARAAGKKSADLDGDGDMEKVKEDLKLSGAARAARSAVAQDLAGATAPGAAKENMMGALGKAAGAAGAAVAGAPQKTGIPATAKTTVPGLRATQQDLKQANASAALGEKTKNKKSSENIGAGLKHIAKGAAGAVAGHVVGKAINPALAPAGAAIGSKLATR